ncbi:LysR family transcriptional regulator [Blastococcus saxobsidens]|uniref:Transcriptional regulator, LysR-family n=1 Tax=Blastococcus saxobsidens (strain DD2) TaxID=1146883 RepID=H6RNQ7_BLASD|nr:LysR family transcriptional regulator [Blastococcus saxobsidens]CCG05205.1 Transcriptional regulator, LysR-family [Blastococcus saxobsidens DD2]
MADDLSLRSLDLLVAVAETGSLGLAARRLEISQPAASQRMRALEEDLGVTLLRRSALGSELTSEGELVVEWARAVLAARNRLRERVSYLHERRGARLPVAASLTIAEFLLPRWLVSLRGLFPHVVVALRMGNSAITIEALQRREVQVAFVENVTPLPADINSLVVGEDCLTLVTAPDHEWAIRGGPVTAEELATTPLVTREQGSGTREALERVLEELGGIAPPVLEVASTLAVKSAVAEGLAPTVLSHLAAQAELATGRLVEVPVTGVDLHRPLRALWHRRHPPVGAAEALLDLSRGPQPEKSSAVPVIPMSRPHGGRG